MESISRILPKPYFQTEAQRRSLPQVAGSTKTTDQVFLKMPLTESTQSKMIVGDYKIIKRLGEGSFGAVFLAKHIVTKHKVAIKMIAIRTSRQDDVAEREAVLLQTLQDKTPHIIKLIEVIRLLPNESPIPLKSFPATTADTFREIRCIMCLVMEYFEGNELLGYVQDKTFLREETAAHIFRQLLRAIQAIHNQGVVHRDLKLENLLINSKKEIRVIDFGLSQFMDADTKLTNCVGSAVYCAPEVFGKESYCGFKADIWSCGIILYAMVSGEFPWEQPDSPAQIEQMSSGNWVAPVASPLCVEFIDTMMQLNPENRLSIPELLAHPWMQKHPELPKEASTTSRLCSFVEVIKSHTPFVSIHA